MGILKDISETIKDASQIVKEVGITTDSMKKTSIAKMSAQSTLQFPIITSRALDVDTAQSVSKALERQYATFVQMVISLNPYLDLHKEDMPGYLRKIHQNNPKMIEINESCMSVYSDNVCDILFSINEGCNGSVLSANKNQLFSVEDHLNGLSVNNMYRPKSINVQVAESSLSHFCKTNNIVMEAAPTDAEIDKASDQLELKKLQFKHQIGKDKADAMNDIRRDMNHAAEINAKNSREDRLTMARDMREDRLTMARNAREDKNIEIKNTRDDKLLAARNSREDRRNAEIDEMKRQQTNFEIEKLQADYRSKTLVKLSDNDIKKSNELVPTTLSVTMQIKDGSSFGGVQNFIVGVKGLMHPVDSNEMVSNLVSGFKSGNKFFNFIRWTTGEIAFLKDLVLNIDEIKEDVVKKHSGGSHWWTTLKRRKTASKIQNIRGKNKLLPNASIVCSMDEVVEMQETYGLDLMDIKNAKKLMDQYFLLAIAIVDNSQELCYFMFDGESNYQAVSFKGLEKENNSKNDFKEIYKMINSGRL